MVDKMYITQNYRYKQASLLIDSARSITGLFLCGGIIIFLDPLVWIAVFCYAGLILFGGFLCQTILKTITIITLSKDKISLQRQIGPLKTQTSLNWADLSNAKLKFYAKKRHSQEGLMELSLSNASTSLKLDSHLNGFNHITDYTGTIIDQNNIEINTTTRTNFAALGIRISKLS